MNSQTLAFLCAGLKDNIDAAQYDALYAAAMEAAADPSRKLAALYVFAALDRVYTVQAQSDEFTARTVESILGAL